MSLWLIAWKSIKQRGLASVLTGFSMAIGVCLVVMVLSIHGVVAQSFNNGSSVGYNMIIGARGGPLQLVLNTVFYLSKPIQTIPYEYYLAFEDAENRGHQMRHSFVYQSKIAENQTRQMLSQLTSGMPGGGCLGFLDEVTAVTENDFSVRQMRIEDDGIFSLYAKMAIPICMGDTFGENSQYRVVATTPAFFNELEIDVETGQTLSFSEGRAFDLWNPNEGVLQAVVGSRVAAAENLKLGDPIRPIHGDIGAGGHEHVTEFKVVGILAPSGTRNDVAVFINIEGFYMMDEHRKPLEDERKNAQKFEARPEDNLSEAEFQARLDQELAARLAEAETAANENSQATSSELSDETKDETTSEPLRDESSEQIVAATPNDVADTNERVGAGEPNGDPAQQSRGQNPLNSNAGDPSSKAADDAPSTVGRKRSVYGAPLPIEQRELTAILLRSHDDIGASLNGIRNAINLGQLENEMDWTQFSPRLQQRSAQTVIPVEEVKTVFDTFVTPVQWLILAMTIMICIVSGIGILVSIYNSMSERRQEIAVMRALGADQGAVTSIILAESVILAAGGGVIGWVVAHVVNGLLSPMVQERTGVEIGFFDFAPGFMFQIGGMALNISSEWLLVPGLIVLAILVGLLPALTAYRLDVSENLN